MFSIGDGGRGRGKAAEGDRKGVDQNGRDGEELGGLEGRETKNQYIVCVEKNLSPIKGKKLSFNCFICLLCVYTHLSTLLMESG